MEVKKASNFFKLNHSQARVWDLQAKIKVVKGKLRKPITTFFHHFSGIFDNRRWGVLLDSTPLFSPFLFFFRTSFGRRIKIRHSLERIKPESYRNPVSPSLPHYGMSLSLTGSRLKTFVWG